MLVDDREVRVTSPDRVLVDGVTKADASRFLLAVGHGILGALRDRLLIDLDPQAGTGFEEAVAVASAYSIRPGGFVSAPLRWEELDIASPRDFDVDSMPGRFAAIGDLAP